ncbi:MAG: ATP-dependent DNA helicase [Chloroflexota bacterium]|nr:ATP-dependent DNA helicase [Chloroflexota bacterium]
MKSDSPAENNSIEKILTQLGSYLSDYKPRPGQVQMAEAVAQAIAKHENLVVEGGTGIGKSMAYLIPALLSVVEQAARVLIATSHKPLQDQIGKKDLPLLELLFKKQGYAPFTYVTLKGISNYLCWQSADNEQGKIAINELADKAVRYARKEGDNFSGDFEDLPFNLPPESRALLSANNEDCLGGRCPQREQCYALRIRRKAEQSSVVITNHSLLSLDIRSEGAIIPGKFNTYIIDEGHNFEDNATKANSLQITIGACRRFINSDIVRRSSIVNSQRFENAQQNLERLQTAVAALFVRSPDAKFQDFEDENKVLLKNELPAGRELAESIKDLVALVRDLMLRTEEESARSLRIQRQGANLVERLSKISVIADPNLVYYAERTFPGGGPTFSGPRNQGRGAGSGGAPAYALYGMPISVAGYLEGWFAENNVIVTSATLSDGQSFDFFTKQVGMKNPVTLTVPSPFNYKEQVRLFLPQSNSSFGQGWKPLAESIAQLLSVADGRALVLFTSHAALEGVWRLLSGPTILGQNELRDVPGRRVFKQGESQMSWIITEFQATEKGVIFGTRSWWQGVDLPGMAMVIMDKLPFPQLNDPIVKARSENIEGAGGNSFKDFMLPSAIITFRQGFGRLMRKEDDRGVVVICDERIVQKSYGRRFLKSLPEVVTLENLQKVAQFYTKGGF